MTQTRRRFLVGLGTGAAVACTPTPSDPPGPTCTPGTVPAATLPIPPGSPGLIDEATFQSRVDEFLRFATEQRLLNNPTNLMAHATRSRRERGYEPGLELVTIDDLSSIFAMLDDWKDTGDFQLMYLHWLLAKNNGELDASVVSAIDERLVQFRYWYDDPLPTDRLDHKWFWSENHRVIFAVVEYLSGQRHPETVFAVTGLTGAEHRRRARERIDAWIDERARFGFSEWHSNVYMLKNVTPLLTLIELVDERETELIVRASSLLDLCLLDIAMNLQSGAYGATRGRTYKKDKMSARDEATFGSAKFLFDDTERTYTSRSDTGAVYLASAERYRLPEVIRRIAVSSEVATVRERHGVYIDPHEPVSPFPVATAGYDYADPANLAFWWSGGALTTWHNLPQMARLADRFRLWETDLFRQYSALRVISGLPTALVQIGARELASMAAAGALSEAHTVCWRSPEAMLSTVVDHRCGDAMEQSHAWQATLDPDALVFTTHPAKETPPSLDWRDDDGYWTGTASMPRSIQIDRTAIHLYWPRYLPPTDPLLGPLFGFLPETHAYFPQDYFDEVREGDGWTFGRLGDGFIGLWSWRPTAWRAYDPAVVATRGMVKPFDLVAGGGADNVWIVEVGRTADDGSFDAFEVGCRSAPIAVERSVSDGFAVDYESPAAGRLRWSTLGGAERNGRTVELRVHERIESPWIRTCGEPHSFTIVNEVSRLDIDLPAASRMVR